ncbi:hypothetical protein [Candidatus Mycoplasma mahonii]|uniref:hypothetical protein n=1 Tax=Candidatus Mycoplasma mahonii TaxID=3004105 RepID=UPI0026EE5D11|nr:hypothetical protein [Candidatus Mycoplasma mahonii]WKX02758.1 hypothetical protein O3I44_01650 [Candidatus Mycoplasma mahonii]
MKVNQAYMCASESEVIYLNFIKVCKHLFHEKILGVKAKRSVDEFMKEFKKRYHDGYAPKRSWIYYMAKSPHYSFIYKWLPSTKKPFFSLKSDDERKKLVKYNSIEVRPDKILLRQQPNNYEIDMLLEKELMIKPY